MENDSLKNASILGFVWRFLQNFSTQFIGLVIQIILARILMPSDYGLVSLTSTTITILNVIVSTGFTSAIVQKKEVDELDRSSMFYFSIIIGVILYIIVFLCAPKVGEFYAEEALGSVLRVQSISLIISSLCSVHNAVIMRNLEFKKTFTSSLLGVVFQGIVGISMAIKGYGVWALVCGTLVNNAMNCLALFVICKWKPKLVFSFKPIISMFSFSSKILAGNLLNTIYNSCKTLVIGKAYNLEMVGYYNKGYQYPTVMMTGIDGAMTTVLFSSLSKLQDDKAQFVTYLRKSMKLSLTVVTPMLCGMAAVADPMIRILLTDKWEKSIPFVMITCLLCLTWPLSARTQALNSIGKSGTNLIVNIFMKVIGFSLILASIPFGVYVMCLSSLIGTVINTTVYTILIARYFDYPAKQQLEDVVPIYLVGIFMFVIVYGLSLILQINIYMKLIILICIGATVYISISWIFKMEGFMWIVNFITNLRRKAKGI